LGFLNNQKKNKKEEQKKIKKKKKYNRNNKKKQSVLLTNTNINTSIPQIILTKNIENLSTKWLDNKINFYKTSNECLNLIFKKNTKGDRNGLNINFQSHGIQKNRGYNLLLPITTFLEESAFFIDNNGKRKKSIPVSIRKINMRSILQILKAINSILLEKPVKRVELQLEKDIVLLKYGIIYKRSLFEFLILPNNKIKKEEFNKDFFENVLLKEVEILKIKKAFNLNSNKNY